MRRGRLMCSFGTRGHRPRAMRGALLFGTWAGHCGERKLTRLCAGSSKHGCPPLDVGRCGAGHCWHWRSLQCAVAAHERWDSGGVVRELIVCGVVRVLCCPWAPSGPTERRRMGAVRSHGKAILRRGGASHVAGRPRLWQTLTRCSIMQRRTWPSSRTRPLRPTAPLPSVSVCSAIGSPKPPGAASHTAQATAFTDVLCVSRYGCHCAADAGSDAQPGQRAS